MTKEDLEKMGGMIDFYEMDLKNKNDIIDK